jgi:hypothetical protein
MLGVNAVLRCPGLSWTGVEWSGMACLSPRVHRENIVRAVCRRANAVLSQAERTEQRPACMKMKCMHAHIRSCRSERTVNTEQTCREIRTGHGKDNGLLLLLAAWCLELPP